MPSPKNPNTLRRCSHGGAVRVMPGTPVEWCGVCGSLRLVKSKLCKATQWMPPGLGRRVIRERLEEAGFYKQVALYGVKTKLDPNRFKKPQDTAKEPYWSFK